MRGLKVSNTLLKVKSFSDMDVVVLGYEKGKGKNVGVIGALNVKDAKGNLFKVGTGFTDAERANPPKVGEIVTVKYQVLTHKGIPRFPTYLRRRTDLKKLGKD